MAIDKEKVDSIVRHQDFVSTMETLHKEMHAYFEGDEDPGLLTLADMLYVLSRQLYFVNHGGRYWPSSKTFE